MAGNLSIEEISDLDAAWPEVGPIFESQAAYHQRILGSKRLPKWRELQRQRMTSGPDALILVARIDGSAVGVLNGSSTRNPSLSEETYFFVDNVHVLESHRRRGIARALLDQAEAWCHERGIVELQLLVADANPPAMATWRDLGFAFFSHRMSKQLEAPATSDRDALKAKD